MPVDGTFGRLSAHNSRMKELKHKKSERKKNINSGIKTASSSKKVFTKFNPETVETAKSQIRLKAQVRNRKEKVIMIVLSILVLILTIYFTFFVTSF